MTVATQPKPVSALGGRERAELILSHIDRLPTLPITVARLLAVTSSQESCARDVVQIIETDAALTAGMLRLVRRADLATRSDDMTVARAVSLLGFRAVRNAVLSTQFFGVFANDDSDETAMETRRELWRHNLGVACLAEAIAEKANVRCEPADAFVCGLLHDIGKIALDSCLPKSYRRVIESVRSTRRCICDAETELFGLDHTIAGKRLTSRWGLPKAVVECAWLHHQGIGMLPSNLVAPEFVKIVHLADGLARAKGVGYSGYIGDAETNGVAEDLGLSAQDLTAIGSSLARRMSSLLELVGLDAPIDAEEEANTSELVEQQLRQVNAELFSNNERLASQLVFFEAIDRFAQNLGEGARLSDVCQAAASAANETVAPNGAMCWFVSEQSTNIYVAASRRGAPPSKANVVDSRDFAAFRETSLRERSRSGKLGDAIEAEGELWQHIVGVPPSDRLISVALVSETVTGGLLFCTDDSNGRADRFAAEDCRPLASSIAMAAGAAAGRMSAEGTAEELVELNRKLRSAQSEMLRMRSISMISEMAAGAAHELNNPLAVISGRAQMEHARVTDPDQKQAFQTIIDQTRRASEMVMDLMRYAKPERPTPIAQSVAAAFEAIRQHWTGDASAIGDRFRVELHDPGAMVYADAGQLIEMLNHLISNAVMAVAENGGDVILRSVSGASRGTVQIIVSDEGCGMTPGVLEHAIDPFFSYRAAGRGRGLGLSRAYRLAEINGGNWRIDSSPNAGTSVVVELPSNKIANRDS